MSERKWPVSAMGTRWLTYCPHDGWDEHDTPEDGERAFGAIMDLLSDESADGWYESADRAAWGVWLPVERLRLVAIAWPDDDSEDGERCRDAGWDVILQGVVRRVEPDAAALEFCAEFADVSARERIAELEAEVARLRRVLAVERGDESAAPDGWRPSMGEAWAGVARDCEHYTYRIARGLWDWVSRSSRGKVYGRGVAATALEAMEAADRAAKEVSDV